MKSIQFVAAVHGIMPLAFGVDQRQQQVWTQAKAKSMRYGPRPGQEYLQRGRIALISRNLETDV